MKMACLTLALAFLCALPVSAQTVAPSASPDPMEQPLDVMDGLTITPRDLTALFAGVVTTFTPAKAKHPSSVIVTKPQSEMPSYDPDWHYVSSATNAFGDPEITIWTSEKLGGKAPMDLMMSTATIGLLDAGYGGPHLQAAYAKERAADVALGPNASNPWKNRRALGDRLAEMLDNLMELLKKKQ